MSVVQAFGHFAVIGSSTEYKKAYPRLGWKRIALVEIDPMLALPSRIDPRIKSLKRIIYVSEDFATYLEIGFHMHRKEWARLCDRAERWDRLYPLHIVAKDWPLPLPVYTD